MNTDIQIYIPVRPFFDTIWKNYIHFVHCNWDENPGRWATEWEVLVLVGPIYFYGGKEEMET